MDTLTAIRARRAVRAFRDTPLTAEQKEALLEAASCAPIGMAAYSNVRLTVITDPDLLEELRACAAALYRKPEADPYYHPPYVMLVATCPTKHLPHIEYANAGCLIENVMLEAAELGLGSVYYFGAVQSIQDNAELLAKLHIPEGYTPISAVGVGVPAAHAESRAPGWRPMEVEEL